jgi:ABC-type transport system involved in multi-copper enzyme maturation permease subunit
MFPGVMALLERSLRVDARAWVPHLARFGLMLAIYAAAIMASTTFGWFAAPGLRFFRSIAYLNLTFMSLLGVGFFSTVITEEKEEDTLGLMLMAGISPLGILLGKSVGRLVQALLLIVVQYPFTLLAVTMGGVTSDQVFSTYVAMVAYMIMLTGVGMLCSTIAPRSRSASIWLTMALMAYYVIPLCAGWYLKRSGATIALDSDVLAWVARSCVYLQMRFLLSTGYQETLFSHQVVSNILVGGLGFVLSWALFGIADSAPSTEASSRGLVTKSLGTFRFLSPGRPNLNPFVWKDFHFAGGGFASLILRVVVYLVLYSTGPSILWMIFGGWSTSSDAKGVTGTYLFLTMFLVSLDAGLLVSRSFQEEIRGQTLATLMMLPKSTGMILYSKIAGSLLVWLPGPICLLLGIIVLPEGYSCVADFFDRGGSTFLIIALLLVIPHVAAIASIYVRWGALPLGIGAAIGLVFLAETIFQAMRLGPHDVMVYFMALVILCLSCCCHIAVWLRTEALSAR